MVDLTMVLLTWEETRVDVGKTDGRSEYVDDSVELGVHAKVSAKLKLIIQNIRNVYLKV